MKVFINPGHSPDGHPDPGAVNKELALRECVNALWVGERVAFHLQRAGIQVLLLQSDNLMGEGQGPCVVDAANAWGADAFLSIHCNASDTRARGVETLCYGLESAGGRLAAAVQQQVWKSWQVIDCQLPDRGVKARPELAVLRATEMPAILVEAGFIDNMEDAWLLCMYAEDAARAVARGVTDWGQAGKEG